MANPFGDELMAVGYAANRPPSTRWSSSGCGRGTGMAPVPLAVDVGCGAGLSTAPLASVARQVAGFDPAESMVRVARRVVPTCAFLTAAGEAMPFADGSVDLLAAAGSLNYTRDLDAVWAEAARVLVPGGTLAVYDFAPGRSFADDETLDAWFTAFTSRYPYPHRQAIPLSPAILADRATGFRIARGEEFALPLDLTPEFYLGYMLTETNVQDATRRGTALDDIRSWCEATLTGVFDGRPRPVVFRGYLVTLTPLGR